MFDLYEDYEYYDEYESMAQEYGCAIILFILFAITIGLIAALLVIFILRSIF